MGADPGARPLTALRAGVVGTGFVGVVHVDALRLLGVEVAGVVGSSPARAAAKGIAPVYESLEALLADESVDVVHLTTPNHLHHPQAKQVLAAGKHVVCEKPLAMTSEESAELLALAEASGLVHCTNFNLRFFPLVHEARARVAVGELGEVWNVHGGYLQDWLLYPTDWNWRLEPDKGGALRAVGDIGSHWMDMAQFVSGQRDRRGAAPTSTRRSRCGDGRSARSRRSRAPPTSSARTRRWRPRTSATCSSASTAARAARSRSRRAAAGRKNSLHFEVDGSEAALAWNAERHEELWLGRRDEPNESCSATPRSCSRPQPPTRSCPPATPRAGPRRSASSTAASTPAVAAGGPPSEPDYPTFADGHRANVLGDAIALSNAERRWVEVRG